MILTVARLVRVKGIDNVIKALSKILEAVPNAVYLVVGDGPLRAELEQLARDLGVSSRVVFAGAIDYLSDDLPRYYRACDVFCLPCRTDSYGLAEGFPEVIAEAMAFGKPVISTRHVEIPRILDEIVVDENDVPGLAEAIRQIYQSETLRQRLGEKNRRIAEQTFSTRNARKTAGILHKLAEQHQAPDDIHHKVNNRPGNVERVILN